jgi:hypothetical protein
MEVSTPPGIVQLLEMSKSQGPELHLDVSMLQRPGLLLKVSSPQRHERHVDLSSIYTTETCAAPRQVYTLQPQLHLDVSNPQWPVLIKYLFALLSRLTQFTLLWLFKGMTRFASLRSGGLQGDVVYFSWPIGALVYEPKCGGRGGVAGSQPMRTAVHITWHRA